MQFSVVALFAAAAVASVVTETEDSTTTATITSCGPEVTSCPAKSVAPSSSAPSNGTAPVVTSYEASGNRAQIAGAAALAAGALLAL